MSGETRYAKITLRPGDDRETVEAYLPENYEVAERLGDKVWIRGHDERGWTLDEYVLPRLASGLLFGEEVHPERSSK